MRRLLVKTDAPRCRMPWPRTPGRSGLGRRSTQSPGRAVPSQPSRRSPSRFPQRSRPRPAGSSEDTFLLGLGLTSAALYVRDGGTGTLWRTASPSFLPLNTSRPSLTRSGSTLTCRRGSWRHADRFSYAWRVNGTTNKDVKPRLAVGKARKRRGVSCSVTGSNAVGTTTASSAQLLVRRTAANR